MPNTARPIRIAKLAWGATVRTAAGRSVEDAATLTWTGLRASEYGYDKVTVIQALPQGAQGNYDDVRVHFSR